MPGKLTSYEGDFPTWFDHLEETSFYKEIQVIKLYPPVNTSCPLAGNVNEMPAVIWQCCVLCQVFAGSG